MVVWCDFKAVNLEVVRLTAASSRPSNARQAGRARARKGSTRAVLPRIPQAGVTASIPGQSAFEQAVRVVSVSKAAGARPPLTLRYHIPEAAVGRGVDVGPVRSTLLAHHVFGDMSASEFLQASARATSPLPQPAHHHPDRRQIPAHPVRAKLIHRRLRVAVSEHD